MVSLGTWHIIKLWGCEKYLPGWQWTCCNQLRATCICTELQSHITLKAQRALMALLLCCFRGYYRNSSSVTDPPCMIVNYCCRNNEPQRESHPLWMSTLRDQDLMFTVISVQHTQQCSCSANVTTCCLLDNSAVKFQCHKTQQGSPRKEHYLLLKKAKNLFYDQRLDFLPCCSHVEMYTTGSQLQPLVSSLKI